MVRMALAAGISRLLASHLTGRIGDLLLWCILDVLSLSLSRSTPAVYWTVPMATCAIAGATWMP
jgi:hypothetical protein